MSEIEKTMSFEERVNDHARKSDFIAEQLADLGIEGLRTPATNYLVFSLAVDVFDVLMKLRQRITDLEARPSLKYTGIFEPGREYMPGECVTDQGSMFHANRKTYSRPGDGDAWSLCVKRGRDGRDGR